MPEIKKIELLLPAGNWDCLKAAVENGADAVYFGIDKFNARRRASNFELNKIKEVIEKKLWIDAKSLFQEKAQELENATPSYKVLAESGPDHEKVFTMGVFLGDELVADGYGDSKQEAEQDAARKTLKAKKWQAE